MFFVFAMKMDKYECWNCDQSHSSEVLWLALAAGAAATWLAQGMASAGGSAPPVSRISYGKCAAAQRELQEPRVMPEQVERELREMKLGRHGLAGAPQLRSPRGL